MAGHALAQCSVRGFHVSRRKKLVELVNRLEVGRWRYKDSAMSAWDSRSCLVGLHPLRSCRSFIHSFSRSCYYLLLCIIQYIYLFKMKSISLFVALATFDLAFSAVGPWGQCGG